VDSIDRDAVLGGMPVRLRLRAAVVIVDVDRLPGGESLPE
jgi:hypothetical protein